MVTVGFLRLAGDLRRHCRRGHLLEVRDAIADPAVSFDCAAVAGVAGGKSVNLLGFLSDERNCAGLRPDQDPRLNALIID